MTDVVIEKMNEVYVRLKAEPHIIYELAPYFEFEVTGAKYMPETKKKFWDGKIRLLSTHNGQIYAGLIDRLISKIKTLNYSYEFKSNKYYGLPFEINQEVTKEGVEGYMNSICTKFKAYDHQINSVYECLRYNRKTIVSATSSGKTNIIYSLMRYYLAKNMKVLIIFPRTSLIKQTYKDWTEYGWNPDEDCHLIYSGNEKSNDKSVILSTWQSIFRMPTKFFEDFDCVMVDECHEAKSSSIVSIMKKCHNAKYRFGFTGTLSNGGKDSKPHEWVISGLFGPSYKAIATKELIEKGRASELNIHCILLKHKSQRFFKYEDEVQYLISNEKRNNFIKNLSLKLKGNTLVLFSRVDTHGRVLYDLINNNTTDDERKVFFIFGGVDADERESVREIVERENNAIIVASYGVFSTGVSINNLHNVIFAFPSKSKIRNLQSIGRVLRKGSNKLKANVYDIADDLTCNNHKNFTLNHFIERIKTYNEEEFEYEILDVDLKEN